MPKTLVIVESPTKAKTITKFLGTNFRVESSFGHIRDLPKSKMGIDIAGGTFEPQYLVPTKQKAHVAELKELAKKSDEIIFATDEDREGEAISWHLAEVFKVNPKKAKRIVFHEITKHAIEHALANPRAIDQKLVDAQQARRVLDRLVGYELSPFLWQKVARGLSAGRVQSVAVRLIVEREREILKFNKEEYWSLTGTFNKPNTDHSFPGLLHAIDDKKIDKLDLKNQPQVDKIITDLTGAAYLVKDIVKKETKMAPPPPFTTSTLQQQANNKLGFSAKQTMRLAQQLYEGVELGSEGHVGLITYMRTDAVNLAEKFLTETNAFVAKTYGDKYALEKPRFYANKSKGAQEAHEAIRPTDPERTPDSIKAHLTPAQFRLYNLIWKRAIATQMSEAKMDKTAIDISAKNYLFRANGQIILFAGWLKLYPEKIKEESLPEIILNEKLTCTELKPEQHYTEPPARYSDATLIKVLETYGVGRPSTYAPTISTIEDRNYIERDENKRLKPMEIAFTVTDLLVEHFPNIVDYQFTAEMEEKFDQIAAGEEEWQPVIKDFYGPFHANLLAKNKEISKKELTEEKTNEVCDKCGEPMIIKLGRFGKFMACSHYPECKNTKPIGKEAEENKKLEAELSDEACEKCGKPMAIKHGRYGAFLGCSGYPDCKNIKAIEKKTGVKCNLCGQGEFVEKKSKRGRMFYSCNRYPDCKNALWSKPIGENCPTCGLPLVFGAKAKVRCSNKECKYTKSAE